MDIYKTTLTALFNLCFEIGKENVYEGARYTRVHKLGAADYEAGCVFDSATGAKILTYPGTVTISTLNRELKPNGLRARIVSRNPVPLKRHDGNPHRIQILLEISTRIQ